MPPSCLKQHFQSQTAQVQHNINSLHRRAQEVGEERARQTPNPVNEQVALPGEAVAAVEHHGGQHGV